MDDLKEVIIYTDGACEPNPGPGGYGVVLIYGSRLKELSGGFRQTTNNRMEMIAAIKGLEALNEPCIVKLFSDSEYLVKSMSEGWAEHWKEKGWQRTKKAKAANPDLWETLLGLCQIHQVEFFWVKGHANILENERCDELSIKALTGYDLSVDVVYESQADFHENKDANQSANQSLHKKKITEENQPCRKCGTPVIKKTPRRKRKQGQGYYYEYYLYCSGCKTIYMVEDAKRSIESQTLL